MFDLMKCIVLAGGLAVCCGTAQAQHWQNTGIPPGLEDTWMSYTDTVHDALYFGGLGANVTDSSVVAYFPLFRYQGGQWDTLGVFGNAINAAVLYHDTLIVGGAFQTVDGAAMPYITCYAGGAWHPYGVIGEPDASAIYKLRIIDGELYVVGAFDQADGRLCNSIAKRVGGHWENVGDLSGLTNAPTLVDITKYNGNLVVTGNNIHNTGVPLKSVMQYDGTSWGPVGAGILGGIATGLALTVYQGDLYLGGEFFLGAGNAGQSVMRWDGTAWHSLGDGIQVYDNSYAYAGQVTAFGERDGLLLVGGTFYYAGHIPASSIASWDGTNWCSLGGALDPRVRTMTFFHDTLYVGCGQFADSVLSNGAAKFIGSSFQEECSTVGIPDIPTPEVPFEIASQQPGVVSLLGLADGQHNARIYDTEGRLVVQKQIRSHAGRTDDLYLGNQGAALYVIVVDATQVAKWVPIR